MLFLREQIQAVLPQERSRSFLQWRGQALGRATKLSALAVRDCDSRVWTTAAHPPFASVSAKISVQSDGGLACRAWERTWGGHTLGAEAFLRDFRPAVRVLGAAFMDKTVRLPQETFPPSGNGDSVRGRTFLDYPPRSM